MYSKTCYEICMKWEKVSFYLSFWNEVFFALSLKTGHFQGGRVSSQSIGSNREVCTALYITSANLGHEDYSPALCQSSTFGHTRLEVRETVIVAW